MGSPKVPKNGNRKTTPKNAVSRNSISRCHQIVKDCERSLLTIKNYIKSYQETLAYCQSNKTHKRCKNDLPKTISSSA